jgi:hypothetical protein
MFVKAEGDTYVNTDYIVKLALWKPTGGRIHVRAETVNNKKYTMETVSSENAHRDLARWANRLNGEEHYGQL